MQAPPSAGSMYYNYKQTHSIVLMAVCDAQYCFTLVDIGDYGRHSDGGVLSHSNFGQAMESGSLSILEPANLPGTTTTLSYIFVGDAAFPLKTYTYTKTYLGRFLEEDRQVFNYRLSQARRVIENTFGILTTKFRIFRRPIIAHPEKVTQITKAACVLHNYLKIADFRSYSSSRQYCPPGYVDHEDPMGNFITGDWRSETGQNAALTTISHTGSNTFSRSAAFMRDTYKEYFVSSSGELEWIYTWPKLMLYLHNTYDSCLIIALLLYNYLL